MWGALPVFNPPLHGFYAFLRGRITKYCRGKGKKVAGIIKNAAGTGKSTAGQQKTYRIGYGPGNPETCPTTTAKFLTNVRFYGGGFVN